MANNPPTSNVNFVRCDVTSWVEQLALFKSAVARSPNKGVDVVIANAGISGPDALFAIEGIDCRYNFSSS